MSAPPDLLEELVRAVRGSAKYRHVAPAVIARLGARELDTRDSPREAIKATKNKLHQVGGAYLSPRMHYSAWLAELRAAVDARALQAACQRIMAHHASSAERLPILVPFYAAIFSAVGPVASVLDLACGLNPLAIPWMGLAPATRYIACDMYADLMAFLQVALPLLGVRAETQLCDLAQPEGLPAADVALIMKTIPCLEQSHKAAGERLLAAAPAPVLVVTFPTQSLGKRDKGMEASYERHLHELCDRQPWQVETLRFEGELAFIVKR